MESLKMPTSDPKLSRRPKLVELHPTGTIPPRDLQKHLAANQYEEPKKSPK